MIIVLDPSKEIFPCRLDRVAPSLAAAPRTTFVTAVPEREWISVSSQKRS
jgi:hypothetical protein